MSLHPTTAFDPEVAELAADLVHRFRPDWSLTTTAAALEEFPDGELEGLRRIFDAAADPSGEPEDVLQ